MGRPKKDQTVVVYARIPEQLATELREEAQRDRRELSATIRLILESRGRNNPPVSESLAPDVIRNEQVSSNAQPSIELEEIEDKPHPRARSKVSSRKANNSASAASESIEVSVASRNPGHEVGCNCFACIQTYRFIEQQRKEQPAQPEKKVRKRR